MKVEVEKEKLEKVTKLSVSTAIQSMGALAAIQCPIPRAYEKAEDLIVQAEQLRIEAGLETILNAEAAKMMIDHELSKRVAAKLSPEELTQLAQIPEPDESAMELIVPMRVPRHEHRAPMGFQIPETNKNKMN